MDRRRFSLNMASVAGALALAGAGVPGRARAQDGTPVEERDYQTMARPVSVPANGKIEVLEFFWYACPHCFAFEPIIEPWIAKLPSDVHFRRVPVGFDAVHYRLQAAAVRGRADPAAAADQAVTGAAGTLAPMGVRPAEAGLVAALYLADICARYLADGQAESGPPLGRVDAWLLPALTRHASAIGERTLP